MDLYEQDTSFTHTYSDNQSRISTHSNMHMHKHKHKHTHTRKHKHKHSLHAHAPCTNTLYTHAPTHTCAPSSAHMLLVTLTPPPPWPPPTLWDLSDRVSSKLRSSLCWDSPASLPAIIAQVFVYVCMCVQCNTYCAYKMQSSSQRIQGPFIVHSAYFYKALE